MSKKQILETIPVIVKGSTTKPGFPLYTLNGKRVYSEQIGEEVEYFFKGFIEDGTYTIYIVKEE